MITEAIVYVIAYALRNKIPIISSATMLNKLITNYPNIAQHFTHNEWSLFYNEPHTLGVIMPCLIRQDDLHKNFGLINLHPIAPDQAVAAMHKSVNSPADELINAFDVIIDRSSPQHPTRFYLSGHGIYEGLDESCNSKYDLA